MLAREFPPLPRQVISALDVETSYYEVGSGNGRPTLLLHGMSTSADSFREVMWQLADTHWLLAPDIPGFGYSGNIAPYTVPHLVEWLAAFVGNLNLSDLSLVGHSFGGVLATSFALSYPEDVERLLLLAPAILSQENYPDMLKKVGISFGLVDLGSAVSQSSAWVKRQIKVPFYDPDRLPESLWLRRLFDYEQARASADVLKATAFHQLRPLLPSLKQPVCLVWGENDPVVPVADGETLRLLLPQAQLHRIAQCGHAPMLEHPEAFQTIARSFLSHSTHT